MKNNQQKVIFLTGASGVGKTTILKGLREAYKNTLSHILFSCCDDEEKIPDEKEVMKKWGSWEKWQKYRSGKYIADRTGNNKSIDTIVLDQQVNIDFIIQGFEAIDFDNYKILLVTCDVEKMKNRLKKRGQPELFTPDMVNWIKFLEKQAKEKGITILDTSDIDLEESISFIKKEINNT